MERVGIYVNYVKPVAHAGKKFWALGSTVWYSENPNETFHEFIVRVLIETLGREWWAKQLSLSEDEQHFVIKCAVALDHWKQEHHEQAEEVRPGVWSLDPDGLSLYLLSLAFDVASLRHALTLPPKLLDRLRHKDQYQGARYEIALAAIFARIDCELEFLPDSSGKHPEFIAQFRPNRARVAAEAKSRHRPGVLDRPGSFDEEKAIRGDVHHLIREALEQDPGGLPFVIFIDVNAPLTPDIDLSEKPWFKDVVGLLDEYEAPTVESPDPFSAVCFTNYSHHYQVGTEASPAEHVTVWPRYTRDPLDPMLSERLFNALAHYGVVPNLDDDSPSPRTAN